MSVLSSPHGARVAALVLVLSLWAGFAAAAEPAPAVAAKAAGVADAPLAAPASAPTAKKARAADADAAPHGPRDPLDMLREKLAQKLGAVKAPNSANPNVVRVVSKPVAPAAPGSAEPGAAPAGHATGAAAAAPPRAPQRKPAAESARSAAELHAVHWDYAGSGGPEAWGRMKPEFSKCASGTRQSPIDIRDGIKVQLDAVQFDYRPSPFRVIDNGHTVQVNVGAGNSIEVLGRRYELLQFHFHRPSEERIDGKQFDMVAHLVHKDLEGRLAVVAVLLDRGSAQPVVQSVWNNLPLEKGEEVAARSLLNLAELLPAERSYFTYMGSLTTPPCSEGVLWMVMKTPLPVSAEQIGIFARLYPMNARPLQSAAGRVIKESN